jgi:LacI family transcriptional regulator
MATIYDVAARAGVSPATVSRVLNGASVSPAKARLVRKAAADLSYRPSRVARRLRNQSSELIALMIPDIENPFFTALARGVEDRIQEAGYSVVLCNTDDDPAKENKYLDVVESEAMAGVILAPSVAGGDLLKLVSKGRPMVAVDRATGLDIDAVMIDNRAAGIAATDALYDAGYERVACIAGPREIEATEERSLGWMRASETRELGFAHERYLRHANYRVDGGRAAMRELLEMAEPPDAVLTTNNLLGVGAIQVLVEADMPPPTIGVAVFGELPFSTLAPDAITQVHLPTRHLGRTAAAMLLERIGGDTQPARTVSLRATIGPRPLAGREL